MEGDHAVIRSLLTSGPIRTQLDTSLSQSWAPVTPPRDQERHSTGLCVSELTSVIWGAGEGKKPVLLCGLGCS